MKILKTALAVALAIGLTAGIASAAGEEWEIVSITAEVQDIDLENRKLTLKGPQGNVTTFTVDEQVKRLNEIKVGDNIRADYYVSLAVEIREPTADEKKEPLTVLEQTAKAPPGTIPGAGGLRQIRAVVNVVDIDRPSEMILVKGPLGNTLPVHVTDPAKLEKVKEGDTVIVTYTEALAISLDKVK